MPSKTFQPLLFDAYKYKLPNTTYVDHYGRKIKRKEFSSLERTYSNSLSQKEKTTLLTKRSRPFSSSAFLKQIQKQEEIKPIKKPQVNFDPTILVTEISQRDQSVSNTDSTLLSVIGANEKPKLVSPPPPTPYERSKSILDASNDQLENLVEKLDKTNLNEKSPSSLSSKQKYDYHWMTFKQQETPSYIVEAKKRLGQIKQPHIAPNQLEKCEKQVDRLQQKIDTTQTEVKNEPILKELAKNKNKHWFQWDCPQTPENVAEIRRRLGDDRYKPNNSLKRAQTLSAFDTKNVTDESENLANHRAKTTIIETVVENREIIPSNEQVKVSEVVDLDSDKVKYYVSYEPNNTQFKNQSINQQSQPYYQIANTFNYFDTAKNENSVNYYFDNSNSNNQDYDTNNFILPTKETEFITTQVFNNPNQESNNKIATIEDNQKGVPLQAWLQSANDQDRDAVLKILNSVEDKKINQRNQSESRLSSRISNSNNQFNQFVRVKGKNTPIPTQMLNKKRPITPGNFRKLGVTRNKYQAPIDENLEKILIKHSLWSNQINGPETVHFGYNI